MSEMPKLTLYSFWIPSNKSPTILIAGDKVIHDLFIKAFPDCEVSHKWSPRGKNQHMFDYGYYVNGASEADRSRFDKWLQKFWVIEPFSLENELLDNGFALSYHGEPISIVVRKAKPYGNEVATSLTRKAAVMLVELMVQHIQHNPSLKATEYFVSVPSRNKPFDLPQFMTNEICTRLGTQNGNSYVQQIREKLHSQKDLDSIEAKRINVRGLFGVTNNHPFSGKIITIIDDIYRSGVTLEELTSVLRKAGARRVQALVLTKTFRD
jgi:predicted amidophosphoribosyltransferase